MKSPASAPRSSCRFPNHLVRFPAFFRVLQAETAAELDALLPSLLHRAFRSELTLRLHPHAIRWLDDTLTGGWAWGREDFVDPVLQPLPGLVFLLAQDWRQRLTKSRWF